MITRGSSRHFVEVDVWYLGDAAGARTVVADEGITLRDDGGECVSYGAEPLVTGAVELGCDLHLGALLPPQLGRHSSTGMQFSRKRPVIRLFASHSPTIRRHREKRTRGGSSDPPLAAAVYKIALRVREPLLPL